MSMNESTKAALKRQKFGDLPERRQRLAEMNMARQHARTRTVKRINDYLVDQNLDPVPISDVPEVVPQTTVGPTNSNELPDPADLGMNATKSTRTSGNKEPASDTSSTDNVGNTTPPTGDATGDTEGSTETTGDATGEGNGNKTPQEEIEA